MTEKRFTFKHINEEHISANIYDNNTFIGSVSIGVELIVYLLNELHEENQRLKFDVDYWKRTAEKRFDRIRELEEMIK